MKNNVKIIIVTVLVAACFVALVVALPSFFGDTAPITDGDLPPDSFSLESLTPPPADVSVPQEAEKLDNIDTYKLVVDEILANIKNFDVSFASSVDRAYIDKISQKLGKESVEKLSDALSKGKVSSEDLRKLLGYTEKAFVTLMDDKTERVAFLENTENGKTDFVFVGDCSFADGYNVVNKYKSKGINGLISEEILEIMRSANVTMANNEFTFTTRGKPIPGKIWTFRSNPENVKAFHDMGVDIVSLANNHAFDYGPDSLTDTLATLDGANIARLGAGENLEEARKPYYYVINGYKIAIVAGSAVDPESTRKATDKQSGVFQIFDIDSMCDVIEEAKLQADYVIAYVHWGHENTTVLTASQKNMGKSFVDSGADVVIGMHAHCMQGVEHYKGKLIVYGLGNFTFSSKHLDGGMLKVNISQNGEITNTFYPIMHLKNFTYITKDNEGKNQLEKLRDLSINTIVGDDFVLTQSKD